ncbi:MAG: thiamine pyrophosphate-binding protein, partial [Deltaproteobacteria bacterium]|nr:thiamine pyrophosphate-binding protein [Deltaproteobacteria bacterium]
MQLTGAQTIVQTLKALNVRHVFSLPGTGIMQLLDAFVDEPAIQCVTVRHEQIASHMGDGYARAAKEPGVVLVSRGPGAVNTLVGLVTAHPACSPVVVIAGQAPTSWLGREAFEEFDLVAMFRPTTKYAFEVERMNTLPEVIRRAMRASVTGRPGPVLVSVPFDLLTESDDVAINPARFTYPTRLRPDPQQVEQAATLLVEARNPAIFAGGGVGISDAFEEMQALAEALGCPVVPTSEEDMLPTAHPLLTTDKGLVQQADVVLAVGCRFTEFATSAWTLLKAGQKLIHIDIDPYQIDKVYPADVGIVADAKMALADLLPAVRDRVRGDGAARARERAAALAQKKAEARAKRWPTEEWDTAPIRPWVMVKAMQETFPPDAWIVQDTATLGAWMARCFDFPRAGRYVWSVGGSMGFGLPAAAGVK